MNAVCDNLKIEYYVSNNGNDDGNGTFQNPFKTLERARTIVRSQLNSRMNCDITVILRGGIYELQEPLKFDYRDSGIEGHKVIYENFDKEEPVLCGGIRITQWEKIDENIYKASVPEGLVFHTMYENGKRCNKARYPNEIKNIYPHGQYQRVKNYIASHPRSKFGFDHGDIPYIKDLKNASVYIWPAAFDERNWFTDTIAVETIDYEQGVVTLKNETIYTIGPGSRYFIQGGLELLDSPGEFYLDETEATLYYWPMGDCIEDQHIIVPVTSGLLEFKGASPSECVQNLHFEGITFCCTDTPKEVLAATAEMNGAIHLENARNIIIKNCKVFNTGWTGIYLHNCAQYNIIYGNHIYDIGYMGIDLKIEHGKAGPDFNKKNRVENNYIHDVGCMVGHGVGIHLEDSGENYIAFNRITNSPRYGIGMRSLRAGVMAGRTAEDGTLVTRENVKEYQYTRFNVVEYNDVSNCNTDSQDTGVLQAWGPGPGNVWNCNAIHDSEIHFSRGNAIYLDDDVCYATVKNNVVYNMQKKGQGKLICFISAKGVGNDITNNIFADSYLDHSGGVIDTLAMAGEPNHHIRIGRNIFDGMEYIYRFSNWEDERFSEAENNLFFNGSCNYRVNQVPGINTMEEWKQVLHHKYDQFSLTEDPLFMNRRTFDYRLSYNSPAYALGFEDINFEKIGLKGDYPFVDVSDPLERIFVQREGDTCRGYIELDTKKEPQVHLLVSGRTKNGYFLPNLKEYNLEFESSDTTVAEVNNVGLVRARKEGVTRICIKVTKGMMKLAVYVDVIVDDKITGLEIIAPETVLLPGNKKRIKVVARTKFGCMKDVTKQVQLYSTNIDAVVANSEGELSALVTGKTEIVARLDIGVECVAARVKIKVKEDILDYILPISGLRLIKSGTEMELKIKGITRKEKEMDIDEAKVALLTSDESCLEVLGNGLIKAKEPGNVELKVIVEDEGIRKVKVYSIQVYENYQFPDGWMIQNVGGAEGDAIQAGNTIKVYSNGKNVWFEEDDFSYIYKQINAKNLSISVKVHSVKQTHYHAQAGITFREDLSAQSRNINLRVNLEGDIMLAMRTKRGGESWGKTLGKLEFPVELKLEKRDNNFIGYIKKEGIWVTVGDKAVEMDMGEDITAGIQLFSIIDSQCTEAVISDIKIF